MLFSNMANDQKVLHHLQRKRRSQEVKKIYDHFITAIAIVSPLANLPQLYNVWINKNIAGVSVISWTLFAIISLIWIGYGIIDHDRPIFITNILYCIIQTIIVIGVITV